MKFESFGQLIEAIKSHQEFSNEIKLKRLKKELQILSSYENPTTSIQSIELTSVGIELLLKNIYRQSSYEYKMVLDFEYPFNRPLIFYLKKDSAYAQCKDLLDILLQGSNWGPSLMLTHFLDRMQSVSEIIRQNNTYEGKLMYHLKEQYKKEHLQQMGIKLFEVEQYIWKYLIKSSTRRLMGLTNQNFLLFSESRVKENLVLQFWRPISQISTAKASVSQNKKFDLQVSFRESGKDNKMYFGGQSQIEGILGFLNPIEMIERKIIQIQKNPKSLTTGKYWQDNTQMIKEFTQLIEHYSLKDITKAEKYIKLMKQLIAKLYGSEENAPPTTSKKVEMQKQQIQT